MSMDTTNHHTFALFLLSIACTLVLTGCFDELGTAYDKGDKIAFEFDLVAEAQASDQPATIAVPEPVNSPDTTISLGTELIGKQRSSEVQINYGTAADRVNYVREVPTDTGSVRQDTTVLARGTTAQSGTNFQIDGSYTLPADSSAANFNVTILEGIPDGGDPVRVALRLDGNSGANIEPAETMRYLTVTILPTPSN